VWPIAGVAVILISPRLLMSLRSADCELFTNVSVWLVVS
jgi:hypothetical protein